MCNKNIADEESHEQEFAKSSTIPPPPLLPQPPTQQKDNFGQAEWIFILIYSISEIFIFVLHLLWCFFISYCC